MRQPNEKMYRFISLNIFQCSICIFNFKRKNVYSNDGLNGHCSLESLEKIAKQPRWSKSSGSCLSMRTTQREFPFNCPHFMSCWYLLTWKCLNLKRCFGFNSHNAFSLFEILLSICKKDGASRPFSQTTLVENIIRQSALLWRRKRRKSYNYKVMLQVITLGNCDTF